jgi:beta-mannosidase
MTGVWGEAYDFRLGQDATPQKVEYGTASMAPLETALQILKPEERWPPDWDRWYYLNYDPNWARYQGIDVEAMSGLEEMIEVSQTWAARQIKESVEYLRQRKYAPNASMFLYFWSDPWPCLGGSGLLDYYRRKYKAYDIFGMVYSPVLVSIEWLKDEHYIGFDKRYVPGENLATQIWITNDRDHAHKDASLVWRIAGPDSDVVEEGRRQVSFAADSSEVAHTFVWPIPGTASGCYRMEVELTDVEGEMLSHNWFEFTVGEEGV